MGLLLLSLKMLARYILILLSALVAVAYVHAGVNMKRKCKPKSPGGTTVTTTSVTKKPSTRRKANTGGKKVTTPSVTKKPSTRRKANPGGKKVKTPSVTKKPSTTRKANPGGKKVTTPSVPKVPTTRKVNPTVRTMTPTPPRTPPPSSKMTVVTPPAFKGKTIGATVKVFVHPSVRPEGESTWTAALKAKANENMKKMFDLMNLSYRLDSFGDIKVAFTGFEMEYLPEGAVSQGTWDNYCGKNLLNDYLNENGGSKNLGDYTMGVYVNTCGGGWSTVGGRLPGCGLAADKLGSFPVIGGGQLFSDEPKHGILRHEGGHWFGAPHDGTPEAPLKDDAGNTCLIGKGPAGFPKPIMGGNGDEYWSTCSRDRIQKLMRERYSTCDRFTALN